MPPASHDERDGRVAQDFFRPVVSVVLTAIPTVADVNTLLPGHVERFSSADRQPLRYAHRIAGVGDVIARAVTRPPPSLAIVNPLRRAGQQSVERRLSVSRAATSTSAVRAQQPETVFTA